MVNLRWCVLVVASACSKPAEPEVTTRSPPPGPVPAVAPVAKKLPTKVLDVREGAAFTVRTPKLRPIGVRGKHHRPYSAGNNLMTNVGPDHYVLLDVAHDKELARFQSTQRYPGRNEQVVITKDGGRGVLNFATGAIEIPRITLPNGKPSTVDIVLDGLEPTTWVLAMGPDNKAYYGEWKRSSPDVALKDTLPYFPTSIRAERGLDMGMGLVEQQPGECKHIWLEVGKPARCVPPEAVGMYSAERFEGRWLIDGVLLDDKLEQTPLLPCDGHRFMVAHNEELRRAFASCGDTLALATPTETYVWKEPRSFITGQDRAGDYEIEGLADTLADPDPGKIGDGPISRWVDLRAAVRLETPPLEPVDGYAGAGAAGHVLARAPGKGDELWHADLRGGFVERIATDVKCPHTLYAHASGTRVLLDCVDLSSSAGSESTGSGTWTEVIDFTARIRYHVDQMHAGPAMPANAIGIRGAGNNRRLFVLEL